jgi:hypothetical protein
MLLGLCVLEWNCIMTNIMHIFKIYLSIYLCLTSWLLYRAFFIIRWKIQTNAQGHCKQFFIVLIKLPGHVLASKCHLQGGYTFLASYSSFSMRFGWMWAIVRSVWPSVAEFRGRWPHQANNSPHPPETQTKTGVAYKERVGHLKMASGCRNMSG